MTPESYALDNGLQRSAESTGHSHSPTTSFGFLHSPTGAMVSRHEMFRAMKLLESGASNVLVKHSMESEFRMEFMVKVRRLTVKVTPLTLDSGKHPDEMDE